MHLKLNTAGAYVDAYQYTQIPEGTSLIVTNKGKFVVSLAQEQQQPTTSGYEVHPGNTVMIHGHTGKKIWMAGSDTAIYVQALVNTIVPFTAVDLPHYLYTSEKERYRRLRVDVAQTGFFEGREFRTFYEFNIAAGDSVYMRVVTTVDVILHNLEVTVDEGSLRVTPYAGSTSTGDFSTPLPVIPKNAMQGRPQPLYVSQVTIAIGATNLTGGTALDTIRVRAASATAQQSSIGGSVASERGIAAGTYYYRLHNFGSGVCTGTFNGWWEERPMPNF